MADIEINSQTVKKFRLEKNMTQGECAEAAGISQSFLSRLESNTIGSPSVTHLLKLCSVLNCTIDDLMKPPAGPLNFGRFVWVLSELTNVVGESFDTSMEEGRMVWWSHEKDDPDTFWLWLVLCDESKPRVLIKDSKHPKLYAVIGYCRYHNIDFELEWETE